jgi:hypothetical protein
MASRSSSCSDSKPYLAFEDALDALGVEAVGVGVVELALKVRDVVEQVADVAADLVAG